MEDVDFFQGFGGFNIAYYYDNYQVSYIEALKYDGVQRQYNMVLSASAPSMFVGIEFYNPRMYPPTCKNGRVTQGSISVNYGGVSKGSRTMPEGYNFIFIKIDNPQAGTYALQVSATWDVNDVRDMTVKVYTNQAATFTWYIPPPPPEGVTAGQFKLQTELPLIQASKAGLYTWNLYPGVTVYYGRTA